MDVSSFGMVRAYWPGHHAPIDSAATPSTKDATWLQGSDAAGPTEAGRCGMTGRRGRSKGAR